VLPSPFPSYFPSRRRSDVASLPLLLALLVIFHSNERRLVTGARAAGNVDRRPPSPATALARVSLWCTRAESRLKATRCARAQAIDGPRVDAKINESTNPAAHSRRYSRRPSVCTMSSWLNYRPEPLLPPHGMLGAVTATFFILMGTGIRKIISLYTRVYTA
jgi:hypothetical protein